jgi:hypothetical protein
MKNTILAFLGENGNYSMVMEAASGKTYYALYIGAALLDCYLVESEEADEWLQGKMREYNLQ